MILFLIFKSVIKDKKICGHFDTQDAYLYKKSWYRPWSFLYIDLPRLYWLYEE